MSWKGGTSLRRTKRQFLLGAPQIPGRPCGRGASGVTRHQLRGRLPSRRCLGYGGVAGMEGAPSPPGRCGSGAVEPGSLWRRQTRAPPLPGRPLPSPQLWALLAPRAYRLLFPAALQATDHQIGVEHRLEGARALRPAVAEGLHAAAVAPVAHRAHRARPQAPGTAAAIDAVHADHAGGGAPVARGACCR